MRQQADHVADQVQRYNQELRGNAANLVAGRRQELLGQSKVLSSLGVLIRKSASVPETFVVPAIGKKVLAKPAIPPIAQAPVPTFVIGDPAVFSLSRENPPFK